MKHKKRAFTKTIKIRKEKHEYIKKESKKIEYTLAGFLDMVINFYQDNFLDKNKKL
jgi:hypothetical protein